MDVEDSEEVRDQKRRLLVLLALLPVLLDVREVPVPQHVSLLTGDMYYRETMANPNKANFSNAVRMERHTFNALLSLLRTEGGLKDGKRVRGGEKLMILLHVLKGNSMGSACDRFQHSKDTISKVVHEVVGCMKSARVHFFPPAPTPTTAPSGKVINSYKFSGFFDDCIGALDGTHIPAVIGVDEQSCTGTCTG